MLSRADEIGAGRIDSLVSARDIARRYAGEAVLRTLVLDVVPLAGLLAESARTLRPVESAALAELAGLDRSERERLPLSADRFIRAAQPAGISRGMRTRLLDRFGLFGIRLAAVLIRSGLAELLRLLSGYFQANAAQLKACTVLAAVQTFLQERPRAGTALLAESLERIRANAHDARELQVLAKVCTGRLAVAPELAAEAGRLLGGGSAAERLGPRGGRIGRCAGFPGQGLPRPLADTGRESADEPRHRRGVPHRGPLLRGHPGPCPGRLRRTGGGAAAARPGTTPRPLAVCSGPARRRLGAAGRAGAPGGRCPPRWERRGMHRRESWPRRG
ncbi:hypothetical protein LVY72_24015 [Arthrobacter sp. I2-34]|uniref:Uncharacterized protein n=1 Tax=Arthrobacter hankyongi TaxID=2904801 RepID=A0ABS9LES7_9MICC|nr:hypothetical protein [Arthrobacter hankyongi]MCG2624959.1 hypothetical protein [Arthrobacter hankyongi]